MSKNDDELERLIRLRERQIRARDPHAKDREIQRRLAAKRRRMRRQTTVQGMMRGMLGDLPHSARGAIIGAVVGTAISIVLALTVEAYWVALTGLAATIVLAIVGFYIGKSFDWRDEVRDELKDR